MTLLIFSRIGYDVWVNCALFYVRSSGLLFVGTLVLAGILLLSVRKCEKRRCLFLLIVVAFIVGWASYFLTTAGWTITKLSLDAEDARTAEYAYRNLFTSRNLHGVLRLATDESQFSNVRFYAACRAAEILATYPESTRSLVLTRLKDSAPIRPIFFGTNDINYTFFTPGLSYGPFSVREVIEHRAERLRTRQ